MPKLYLENGAVIEGSIDEIADLAKKLDCGEVADGYRKISGREPKVGDFVKFSHDRIDIVAGKYYKIIAIDDNGDFTFTDDVGDIRTVSYGDEYVEFYEKVNADANEAITADAEPEFKIGDYVVALPSADGRYGITNSSMRLGKVIEVENDTIKIEVVSHEHSRFVGNAFDGKKEYFRKATQREVIFGKAGRKLDEFKVGDIVRVLDGNDSGLKSYDGIITEIDRVESCSIPYHVVKPAFIESTLDTWFRARDLELVCTVENRVD